MPQYAILPSPYKDLQLYMSRPRLLTPAAFAAAVSVPLRTVQHWCVRGRLPGVVQHLDGRRCYRIPAQCVTLYQDGLVPFAVHAKRLAA